jgi:hypothetical protein
MFVQRYTDRVNNLRNYIENNNKITFIYGIKADDNHEQLLEELSVILKLKYPKKQIVFDIFN